MSRTSQKAWLKVTATIRAEGRRNGLPCHLCRGTLGPIDYRTRGEADREAKAAGRYWELGQHRPLALSVDHIIPHAAGGADSLNNAAPAHAICNASAGAKGKAPSRSRKAEAVIGAWWPLNGQGQPLQGRAIPGTRTRTHEFKA